MGSESNYGRHCLDRAGGGVLCHCRADREPTGAAMSFADIAGLVIATAITAYLVFALLFPERF